MNLQPVLDVVYTLQHCKGRMYKDGEGNYTGADDATACCFLGAIRLAFEDDRLRAKAVRTINAHEEVKPNLVIWNDQKETTKEDIIKVLEDLIDNGLIARGEE